MFKANVKNLIVRTSVVVGLATTASIATSQTADANVDMDKVNAAEKEASKAETTSAPAESNTNQTTSTVRYGDVNETVRSIQAKLDIPADGHFGAQTEQAVRNFQANNGLQVDGIAGPATHNALNNGGQASASSNSTASSNETTTSNSTASANSTSNETSSTDPVEVTEEVDTKVAGETVTAPSGGLVATATSQIGAPYAWGGSSPSGFDCSGFINYVFNADGVSLPRTAQGIYDASSKTSSPSVGDVVFFAGTYSSNSYITHAGVYVGNGEFVHAASNGVQKSSLSNSYWSQHYVGAGSVR